MHDRNEGTTIHAMYLHGVHAAGIDTGGRPQPQPWSGDTLIVQDPNATQAA